MKENLEYDETIANIWKLTESVMKERYTGKEETYNIWFGSLRLVSLEADTAVFMCESEFKRDIIAKRHAGFIGECLNEVIGFLPEIEIKSEHESEPDEEEEEKPHTVIRVSESDGKKAESLSAPHITFTPDGASKPVVVPMPVSNVTEYAESPAMESEDAEKNRSRDERRLTYSDEYTFENFIVGSSNRFAHASAINVAENLGSKINPLFIWGPSGLGKTHLMYAIANYALRKNPDMKVIYVKGEEFLNQLVDAIMKGRNAEFRRKYRSADMLLIDDIQFIAGKESTQEEFFHTFDALYEDKKQMILTSDRPPRELTGLEERIRSRFEAGLLADIQPPDYELRIAILRNKIAQNDLDIPSDVVDFLANNLHENIRQLEGVIKKLAMTRLISGQPITMDTVLQTVPDYLRETEPVTDTIDRLISITAKRYGVTVDEILGDSRKQNVKNARNTAMYAVRFITGISFPRIGSIFNRDHSTVHSNISKTESMMEADPVFDAYVKDIIRECRES